jgi:hypothetical protein
MTDALARLQNSDNGGLSLVVAVRGNALVGFLVLGSCFLELDCVDLYAVFGIGKGCVECEGIGFVNVTTFRVLG